MSNNSNQLPAATSPNVPQTDRFQEWREAIHDLRRYFDPALPPLHEMPGESYMTSELYTDEYVFDRTYEVKKGLVNMLQLRMERNKRLEQGKMRRIDRCLAGQQIHGIGYRGLKYKRAPQQDVETKTEACVSSVG